MTFTITFGEPRDVTNPGQDGVEYSFPFSIVDSDLVGTPEQKSQTHDHRIIVPICGSRLAGWHLSNADLVRVLLEFGKRHLENLVHTNSLPAEHTLHFPMITTVTHPDSSCPFDPALIPSPTGYALTVERAKPRIGF